MTNGPEDYRRGPSAASWQRPDHQWPAGQWSYGPAPGPYGSVPAPTPTTGAPTTGGRARMDPAKLFGIAIAVLGALNFLFGFLPEVTAGRLDTSLSVYAVGPAYVPILLLIAGLLALAAFLPGSERSRLAVAAVSVGGAVGALISLGSTGAVELTTTAQVSKGVGAVLLTIFGIIQAVVAIAAYVVGSDLRPRSAVAASIAPAAGPPATAPESAAGPLRSAPWPAAPPPPSAPAPSNPPAVRAGGAGSEWAPPADDDRPTGPQPVVPGPGEPDQAPTGTSPPAPPDPAGRVDEAPTEVYRLTPRGAPTNGDLSG